MMEVDKRIKHCIGTGSLILDLSCLDLQELPSNLPTFLQTLNCSYNKIKFLPLTLPTSLKNLDCSKNCLIELPSNLPDCLTKIYCYSNKIKKLPNNLPSSLQIFSCSDNQISELPTNLPISLTTLFCYRNYLRQLPLKLPSSLKELYCYCNDYEEKQIRPSSSYEILNENRNRYLHITKKYAIRFTLIERPNYDKKVRSIQQVWRTKKYKQIIINMINANNNILSDSFKSYGDLNIINLIVTYI